ncbi:FKBP-type peptidyl-prolyl cis-trans isomerase [Mucilaginibacter panaciglaebae]|uniref:peptidylprolyl isomerase n=1 Tax=Mucilaginibacter panaciglaebae TaxID=502331 RepID=A0ABP7WR49_9SPHI
MKRYLLFLLVATFGLKASAQDDFQRTPKGTMYKLYTHNTSERIKVGDIVTFNVIQKTDKDSVLYSSYASHKPALVKVEAAGDMMDIFPLLTVNDSVLVKVPTDTIYKGHDEARPPFFPKGSSLLILLHIDKVQSFESFTAERKAAEDKLAAEEAVNAEKYIADKKLKLTTTASGLKYQIIQAGTKPKPVAGDTVYVNYVGHTLENKIFDSSYETVAKAAGLQQPGRTYEPLSFVLGTQGIIPGWQEGIALINEGTKATFVIPSKLAYGANAAGPDIPPYSTLVFDIDLVKVVHPKTKPATTVVKKPATKKKTTTKKITTTKKTAVATKKKQ